MSYYSQCWLFPGALTKNGYGTARVDGKQVYTHRAAYEVLVGPITDTLDHVKARGCTSRACYNPTHLEDVSVGENTRRAFTTHCKRGHERTDENTYRNGPWRACRLCRDIRRAA